MRSRSIAALLLALGAALGGARAQDAPRTPPPDPFGGDVAPTWSQSVLAGLSPIVLRGTLRVADRAPGALIELQGATLVVRPHDVLTLTGGQGAKAIEVPVEVVDVRPGALLLRTLGPDAATVVVR